MAVYKIKLFAAMLALGFVMMPVVVFAQEEGMPQAEVSIDAQEATEELTEEPVVEEAPEVTKPSTEGAMRIAIPKNPNQPAEVIAEEADEILSENPYMNLILLRIKSVDPGVHPSQISSLFFTTGEHDLIADARKGFVARPATETEIAESEEQQKAGTKPPRGPREISIGGIVYVSANDWTIWLNGQKITPKRIPPEILDIRVSKDTVRLKWFDAYTNQIFPVKLKSHQRFNIDTRIFLPG